jgi:hypothetical protein
MQALAREGGSRQRKIEFLRSQLMTSVPSAIMSENGDTSVATLIASQVDFGHLRNIPLPLDPSVHVQVRLRARRLHTNTVCV